MDYWRISSSTNQNLTSAFAAHRWGSNRKGEISRLKVGDRLVFYCSRNDKKGGYRAAGVVTRERFLEDERLWLDDLYPFRIGFDLLLGPVDPPVRRAEMSTALGGSGLTHQRQAAIIRLTATEYQTMEQLLNKASVGR